jgi:hypothetical protein
MIRDAEEGRVIRALKHEAKAAQVVPDSGFDTKNQRAIEGPWTRCVRSDSRNALQLFDIEENSRRDPFRIAQKPP